VQIRFLQKHATTIKDSIVDIRLYYLSILKLHIHYPNDTENVHLKHKYCNNQLTKYAT